MSRRKNFARALHKLAEEILVLQERERRFAERLGETRGNALNRAYQEGEKDSVAWVLQMIDMDYSLKDLSDELETYLSQGEGIKVCKPKQEGGEDEGNDDSDED